MKCKGYHKNVEYQKEKLHYDVETGTGFSYLGDRINSGDGYNRTRLGWVKFREKKMYIAERNFL